MDTIPVCNDLTEYIIDFGKMNERIANLPRKVSEPRKSNWMNERIDDSLSSPLPPSLPPSLSLPLPLSLFVRLCLLC